MRIGQNVGQTTGKPLLKFHISGVVVRPLVVYNLLEAWRQLRIGLTSSKCKRACRIDGQYWLVYENRSRADGLDGPFSKIKRSIVQNKAVEGLKSILGSTKVSLDGPPATAGSATVSDDFGGWRQRLFGAIRPLLWFVIISGFIALFLLRNYEGKARTAGVKQLKPEER